MRSENELINFYYMHEDWKSLKLWSWVHDYGEKAVEWNNIFPPVADDRRVFINIYNQVYNAVDSLQDNPTSWVCCAIAHEIEKERKTMNDILSRFAEK